MVATILAFLVPIAFMAFAVRRLMTYLHYFQQEEYDPRRFLKWLVYGLNIDRRLSIGILVLSFILLMVSLYKGFTFNTEDPLFVLRETGLLVLFSIAAWTERDPRKDGKKRLVLTQRAKRLFGCSILLALFIAWQAFQCPSLYPISWVLSVQALPILLPFSALILLPYEKHVNGKFRAEAVQKLAQINPFVIGITGSYGKTSVKHLLAHVLKSYAPTLATPGSVNTEMGIARIIREQLEPHHKYFIAEMGAYGPGSIARLCAFTPPKLAIITAIGPAHYERFKTLEETARTKFELAQAARVQGGKTILHTSVLERDYARADHAAHPNDFILCGSSGDLMIQGITETADGLTVQMTWHDALYTLHAPVYGLHHGHNMALVFAAAATLGVNPDDIVTALKTAPQTAHRLEVKRAGGVTTIDDAYNSNPSGFESALTLLDTLKQPGGRRVLVTPGMVELGETHDVEHARLGRLAGQKADIVIAVAPDRIRSFVNACAETLPATGQLLEMPGFASAQEWMSRNLQPGDTVLLENDLPDLYESRPRL